MMITSPGWNVICLRLGANPDRTYVKVHIGTDLFAQGDGFVALGVPQYIPIADPESIIHHTVWETEERADYFIHRNKELGGDSVHEKAEHTLLPDGRAGQ